MTVSPTLEASPSPSAAPSAAPTISPSATPRPTPVPRGTATRLVITALKIDLPVIAGGGSTTPCGVALYLPSPLYQPGDNGAVYLYGAQLAGTLLPLRAAVRAGRDLVGMEILVYTSADVVFTYKVSEVRRHVDGTKPQSMTPLYQATTPHLWIQTADDLRGTGPGNQLQLVAPQTGAEAADPSASHPTAKPKACP